MVKATPIECNIQNNVCMYCNNVCNKLGLNARNITTETLEIPP